MARTFVGRRRARLLLLLPGLVLVVGVGASALLLGDPASPPVPTAATAASPDRPSARSAPRIPPRTPAEVERAERTDRAMAAREERRARAAAKASATQAAAVGSSVGPPPLDDATSHARVAALRDLERRDPAAAAASALRLVRDPAPLVRLNAAAVLARNPSPEAARAIARLDPETRQLALALKSGK